MLKVIDLNKTTLRSSPYGNHTLEVSFEDASDKNDLQLEEVLMGELHHLKLLIEKEINRRHTFTKSCECTKNYQCVKCDYYASLKKVE